MRIRRARLSQQCRLFRVNIRDCFIKERTGRSCVYVFHGRACPSLFLSTFLPILAGRQELIYSPVFIESGDKTAFERCCFMGFFGRPSLLWVGDLGLLPAAAKKSVLAVSVEYTGPHQICLFCSDKAEKERDLLTGPLVTYVSCDDPVSRELFLELAGLLGHTISGTVWDLWTAKRGNLSLEDTCRLIWYGSVGNEQDWFSAWETRLFASDQSLFKLSQYFFAQDRVQFIKLWHLFASEYPPEFWVVYWSEQLWQAHMVVASMRQGVRPAATNRLPFSFLQRDWRKFESRELVAAHTTLYNTDFCLKNGIGDTYGIELFVMKFINGDFARV